MIIYNNRERIVKLSGYDVQREQLLHPSSIIQLISFLQILLLKMFRGLANVTSGGNFRHNLGLRYLKECYINMGNKETLTGIYKFPVILYFCIRSECHV